MNRVNYQKEMEKIVERHVRAGEVPRLLLHSCCAPCSSAVLERLTPHFEVTVLYYNPNIYPEEEYRYRAREQERFVERFPAAHPVHFREGVYHPEDFYAIARGYEAEPEGGARCPHCYRLRLEEAAREARDGGFDYFTTTLSLSPLKDAQALNAIGAELAEIYGIPYLFSDFKKKDGYRRSVELSAEYGMYRQNYCGCVYSLRRDFVKPGSQDHEANAL